MSVMRRLLTVLLTLLVVLTSGYALACDTGDLQMGPNCVHREAVEKYVVVSTVYRVEDGENHVVWKDVGEVRESRVDYLIIHTMVFNPDYGMEWKDAKFPWVEDRGEYRAYPE